MFSLNDGFQYWMYKEPTDMRKSFYTLSGIVRKEMNHDPLDGSVLLLSGKNGIADISLSQSQQIGIVEDFFKK